VANDFPFKYGNELVCVCEYLASEHYRIAKALAHTSRCQSLFSRSTNADLRRFIRRLNKVLDGRATRRNLTSMVEDLQVYVAAEQDSRDIGKEEEDVKHSRSH
jgi:hypothetical protein